MSHLIPEWQIDMIKENISHFCEAQINHSQLSYEEKDDGLEGKYKMKLMNSNRTRLLLFTRPPIEKI